MEDNITYTYIDTLEVEKSMQKADILIGINNKENINELLNMVTNGKVNEKLRYFIDCYTGLHNLDIVSNKIELDMYVEKHYHDIEKYIIEISNTKSNEEIVDDINSLVMYTIYNIACFSIQNLNFETRENFLKNIIIKEIASYKLKIKCDLLVIYLDSPAKNMAEIIRLKEEIKTLI